MSVFFTTANPALAPCTRTTDPTQAAAAHFVEIIAPPVFSTAFVAFAFPVHILDAETLGAQDAFRAT